EVIDKPSSPHLWRGHQATDEIPVDYPTLDRILALLYDKSANPQIVARKLGLRTNVVNDVIFLHDKSGHKRNFPPSLIEIG
ncbi:MAG: NAD(+) synthetase, partial [archaeon]|nr:NAD(+) synthetase [archaeon]